MTRTLAGVCILACVGAAAQDAPGPYQHLPLSVPSGQAAAKVDPAAIPESDYVRATPDGQVEWRGKPVRFWGVIGSFPNLPNPAKPAETAGRNLYAENEAFIRRFEDLGFNLNRIWHPRSDAAVGDYVPGDGSEADILDHFIATGKARGFRFWSAGLGAARHRGNALPSDVGIVDEPATAEAWKTAVGVGLSMKDMGIVRAWDRRLEAVGIREMKRVADHVNRYTGLRVADDPVYAAFELSNEEWWVRRMLGGGWQKVPACFRNALVDQWNGFLRTKYATQDRLAGAWGALLPGEELAKGSVAFAPMASAMKVDVGVNDASVAAITAATGGTAAEVSRETLPAARAADVLEFLVALQKEHKQREAAAVKSWGRATRLVPLARDTGIGYEIQSQHLHQQADVSVHDAYVNGRYGTRRANDEPPAGASPLELLQFRLGKTRMTDNRGHWTSWLEKPPAISQGVPWLEHNSVEGKPFFVYETQIQQPAKYRADFPLRLAALGAIQDWDTVAWHYWGSVPDIGTSPRPFDKAMDITTGGHPQGYHFTYDAVQGAMMRAAGIMFRNRAQAPAAKPTTFIYGRKSLYDPESMRYAGSYGMAGMAMLPTTYQYGVRIVIDPTREDDEIIGPTLSGEAFFTHNPYTPTPEIVFDWKQGFLRMEAPSAVAWTGFLPRIGSDLRFASGVRLSDVRFRNDAGISEPMETEEGYLAFALYAEDGKPLADAARIAVSLVSTSFNTGFRLGTKDGEKTLAGKTPVLHARVGGTVTCPALDGMRYTLRDWHLLPIGEGVVRDGQLRIPADLPVWLLELTRKEAP